MAVRTITRFMSYFDDAGNLIRFEAVGRIDTTDGYTLSKTYGRDRADLPQGFIDNLENVHDQIVAKLDTEDPA